MPSVSINVVILDNICQNFLAMEPGVSVCLNSLVSLNSPLRASADGQRAVFLRAQLDFAATVASTQTAAVAAAFGANGGFAQAYYLLLSVGPCLGVPRTAVKLDGRFRDSPRVKWFSGRT
jgi:hypothetical protein